MTILSEHEIDWLALEGCEIIGFKSGAVVPYDLAGYDRSTRIQVKPGTLPTKDSQEPHHKALPTQAEFLDTPYVVRLSGFRRERMFGPDEIGSDFKSRGIALTDGLGNGLYESLLIDRKYGLLHCLEAPTLGYRLPFLEEEWEPFKKIFQERVAFVKADLEDMEVVYRGGLADEGERFIILWCRQYPLALFVDACQRNPEGVKKALKSAIGREKPPIKPQTSVERLALVKFWNFLRKKQADVVAYQAKILREELGDGLNIIANPHELPRLDMPAQGKIYDYPAVAIRPLLLDDDLFLKHYIAHFSRLFYDLTEKAPMVSVRMNLSAATPRFVPTGRLIKAWYDQAVQFGASGFYFWTRDYPTADTPDCYDGPIPGNTDPVALAKDRWESSLDVLGTLATHQRFIPPDPEVAIFVPETSALMYRPEWRQIYAAFSACCEAGLYVRFISDEQIEENGIPENIKLIFAPVIEFVSAKLRDGFDTYINQGGFLYASDSQLFNSEGHPDDPISGKRLVDPGLFSFFPVGEPTKIEEMNKAAKTVQGIVDQIGIKPFSWVFDITCQNLPSSTKNMLRNDDPSVVFGQWLYEHGSDWITPFLQYGE